MAVVGQQEPTASTALDSCLKLHDPGTQWHPRAMASRLPPIFGLQAELTPEQERSYALAHDRYLSAEIKWHITGWSDGSVLLGVLEATKEQAALALATFFEHSEHGQRLAQEAALLLPADVTQQVEVVSHWIIRQLAAQPAEAEKAMNDAWSFFARVEKYYFYQSLQSQD